MRILALLFAIGCSSDIAIITTEKKPQDTNAPIVDEESDTDSSQPDTEDTTSEMTELTIGFAQLSLTQIACPACMGVSNEFDISASLKLHQPTTGGYTDELTPVGSCVTQDLGSYVSSTPLNVSGAVYFNAIQLYPSGPAEWTAANLYEYQIPRRESITVVTDDGSIPNAFETLEGFDDIQPWELRYVDPSYAFAAVVSKQGTTFSWFPTIPGTQFEIMIVVYSPDGSQILGLVKCMENDNGYMTVPGSYFQSYPAWALAAVYLTRHRIDRQPAYEFNGYLESHQTWTVLGTGHIE
tara:strand:- start:483 stop:1370 length:888 start_codon:yes stop_codon:yes gene_type:complete